MLPKDPEALKLVCSYINFNRRQGSLVVVLQRIGTNVRIAGRRFNLTCRTTSH